MNAIELDALLSSEESQTVERKARLKDRDGIRDSVIAFANDLASVGGGWIIVGQEPDRTIKGLAVGDDEAQRIISDIARNNCTPAIAVSIDCHLVEGKRIAIIEVRASAGRPHFAGRCCVRIGSTNRAATDAEIMALRYVTSNPKLAAVQRWIAEGKTTISLVQLPQDAIRGSAYESTATLVEVTESYVVMNTGGDHPITLPLADFQVGHDYKRNRPQISFYLRPLV